MPGKVIFIDLEGWTHEQCMDHVRQIVEDNNGIWNPDDVRVGISHKQPTGGFYGDPKYTLDFRKKDDDK